MKSNQTVWVSLVITAIFFSCSGPKSLAQQDNAKQHEIVARDFMSRARSLSFLELVGFIGRLF